MSSETQTPWLTVKTGTAGKLGRNGGEVGFRVLRDPDGLRLGLTITTNSGGGCWSPEIVDLDAIERCLPEDRQEAIATKSFARAFVGRSANNAPFAVAALMAMGFLARSADHPNRFQVGDRWFEIKAGLLAEAPGEIYVPPAKAARPSADSPSSGTVSTMTRQETPGETDEAPNHRKGRKDRPPKHAEPGHGDAAPV